MDPVGMNTSVSQTVMYQPCKKPPKAPKNPGDPSKPKRKKGISKKQRDQIKIAIVKGLEYINTKGELVEARKTGQKCSCKLECFKKFTEDDLSTILRKFNESFQNKDEQDIFLQNLINKHQKQRCRARKQDPKPRNYVFKYFVLKNGNKIRVCKQAFEAIYGIGAGRSRRLCNLLSEGATPRDKRGKIHKPKAKKGEEESTNGTNISTNTTPSFFVENLPKCSKDSQSSNPINEPLPHFNITLESLEKNIPTVEDQKKNATKQRKRDIMRIAKVKGLEHVNSKGEFVEARKTGEKCTCKLGCFTKFTEDELSEIIQKFNNSFQSKDEQDIFLQNLIEKNEKKSNRPRKEDPKPRNYVFKYFVLKKGYKIKVCKQAFEAIYGIGTGRTRRLCILLSEGSIPRDKRGKNPKVHVFKPEMRQTIFDHIEQVLTEQNEEIKCSDNNLTVKMMHQLYLKKYPNSQVKYRDYLKCFNEQFDSPPVEIQMEQNLPSSSNWQDATAQNILYSRSSQQKPAELSYNFSQEMPKTSIGLPVNHQFLNRPRPENMKPEALGVHFILQQAVMNSMMCTQQDGSIRPL